MSLNTVLVYKSSFSVKKTEPVFMLITFQSLNLIKKSNRPNFLIFTNILNLFL